MYCSTIVANEDPPVAPRLVLQLGHTGLIKSGFFSEDGNQVITSAIENSESESILGNTTIWDSESGLVLDYFSNATGINEQLKKSLAAKGFLYNIKKDSDYLTQYVVSSDSSTEKNSYEVYWENNEIGKIMKNSAGNSVSIGEISHKGYKKRDFNHSSEITELYTDFDYVFHGDWMFLWDDCSHKEDDEGFSYIKLLNGEIDKNVFYSICLGGISNRESLKTP